MQRVCIGDSSGQLDQGEQQSMARCRHSKLTPCRPRIAPSLQESIESFLIGLPLGEDVGSAQVDKGNDSLSLHVN